MLVLVLVLVLVPPAQVARAWTTSPPLPLTEASSALKKGGTSALAFLSSHSGRLGLNDLDTYALAAKPAAD